MYWKFFAKKNLTKSSIINLGRGDNDSLERRIADPHGETAEFWTNIHEENIEIYEEPSEDEDYDEIINI